MSRSLLILRHAQAGHSFSGDDRGRTLTASGEQQARDVGRRLVHDGPLPEAVICSDAMRTRQTWVWIAEALGEDAPSPALDDRLYLASAAQMLSVVNETPETVQSLLVVAHMPGVQDLCMELSSVHSEEAPVLQMAEQFPTAGLAVFEVEKPWAELDGRDARLGDFVSASGL